jgi:hypothetical protein
MFALKISQRDLRRFKGPQDVLMMDVSSDGRSIWIDLTLFGCQRLF